MTSGLLVLAAAVVFRCLPGPNRWVRILPLVGALAASAFGRVAVLISLSTWLGAVDLFCAMTAMGVAAVMAGAPGPDFVAGLTTAFHPVQVERLAAMSRTVVIVMHVSGIFAAGSHSFTACIGWPIWQLIGSDLHPWLQVLRPGLAGVGAALVLTTAVVVALLSCLGRLPALSLPMRVDTDATPMRTASRRREPAEPGRR